VALPFLDTAQRRRPSGAAVAGMVALAVAAAGGWWLGGASRAPVPQVAADTIAAVGGMRLELEADWVAADAAPVVAGAQAFAPAPGLSARALLVHGEAVDATLVPAALRAQLPETLPAPRRATLGGLAAWSYGPMRDKRRVIEVTVAPTTGGMLAVACSAPAAGWSAALDCADGVHAVSSADAKTLAPAPDLAFRLNAGPVLETLDEKRVAGRAKVAWRRPSAARGLAAAHREAATALAAFGGAEVVAALRDAARSYDALASAGRDRDRFLAARAVVARDDAALVAALRELRR
jgi:hypothetical protein